VEEDLARRESEAARAWWSVAGPLVGLGLVVAALAWAGFYLTRPLSADQLYARVREQVESGELERVRGVEREIGEFVARFPEDARSAGLAEAKRRLELDKMHRQLQRHQGGPADPGLLPVEALYLEAMNAAWASPEAGIAMLDALVRLYGAGEGAAAEGKDGERTAKWVESARRQLEQLRRDVTEWNERRVAAARERLAEADRLEESDPAAARAIRQAVVDLYEDEAWAEAVVAEAKQKLPANHESDD
jgi:hypothetical protein